MAIVRVRSAGEAHREINRDTPKPPSFVLRRIRAMETVLVEIGKPVPPKDYWRCGTDFVWPVLRILQPPDLAQEDVNSLYVCRHVIEAGD